MGYELIRQITVDELCQSLELNYVGPSLPIRTIAPLHQQTIMCLTFSQNPSDVSVGSIAFVPSSTIKNSSPDVTVIPVDSPRLRFMQALVYILENSGVKTFDFPSEVSTYAKIGKNVVIEPGCIIHDHVTIEHNCVIHSGTIINAYSRVRSNSSIGGDGFGFERLPCGKPIRFPHLGGVIIGEHVEIGSLTSVARGALSDTIIEDHVKIDNLVHVAHNCHVKRGAFLTACSELSGGVVVGENAWIAPNACINQKLTIGSEALVGLGAVVTKNVPDRTVYAGSPAKKIRDI